MEVLAAPSQCRCRVEFRELRRQPWIKAVFLPPVLHANLLKSLESLGQPPKPEHDIGITYDFGIGVGL